MPTKSALHATKNPSCCHLGMFYRTSDMKNTKIPSGFITCKSHYGWLHTMTGCRMSNVSTLEKSTPRHKG
ncbi:hypothetical protein Y1Q_0016674 [Alligator mississippiensis]|uniref:Uncharacterized protein n=1 Tax=Alligator mississippiensis TaxID=8496 RepID=A0A151P1F7_ALLMI|nr:hypothetical protein Y1Q_0016674 [Alligator mississippiensis]